MNAAYHVASLNVSSMEFKRLISFRDMVRVLVPNSAQFGAPTDTLFLAWLTNQVRSMQITDSYLVTQWTRFGPDPQPTATQVRKAVTVQGRLTDPAMADELCIHLGHSRETSDHYYNVGRGRRAAVTASNLIRKMIKPGGN